MLQSHIPRKNGKVEFMHRMDHPDPRRVAEIRKRRGEIVKEAYNKHKNTTVVQHECNGCTCSKEKQTAKPTIQPLYSAIASAVHKTLTGIVEESGINVYG